MPFLYSWVPLYVSFHYKSGGSENFQTKMADHAGRAGSVTVTVTVTRLPGLIYRVQPLLVQSLPPTLCTTTPVTISHSHIVYQPALLAYILYHLNSCPTLCPTLPLFGLRNYMYQSSSLHSYEQVNMNTSAVTFLHPVPASRVCVSSNGPQIQIHRLHPVPSTFALLVPSLHQPLPTPTNPWTCSCTRYTCLPTFSTGQTTQFPVNQSMPPTFSPTTRTSVPLPFSTVPLSALPSQFRRES